MKALILAAGSREHRSLQQTHASWVLQPLGDRRMIDYVVDLALSTAAPADIAVVTSTRAGDVARHLGGRYRFAVQSETLGTGDAVLQAWPLLQDYSGPLLILYGDTPLVRSSSILGLITRHRLKGARLSLLSAVVDRPLPYGRIVRDASGEIVRVVEASDATAGQQLIAELNIGAYIVETTALWPAIERLAAAEGGSSRFTDIVALLAANGERITSYRSLDPDEVLGIDTPADLEQASLILQKRQLQPRLGEEGSRIAFGTGGWRARIGEGFTLDHVRRLSQALANDVVRLGREGDGVLIGYDRRFLGDIAAQSAAEVFAGNNVRVELLGEAAPTPLVTFATAKRNFAYGLMFTASHNPARWNGLKVFASDGSLPLDEQTSRIAAEANAIEPGHVVKVELATALQSGLVTPADYTNDYVDAVEAQIDMAAIREAGLRLALDPMYGTGSITLEIILVEARCRVATIRGRHDPLFGGRSPAPDPAELSQLMGIVREERYDLGLAMDGDADRIAIVDDQGRYISANELLLLLYYYLHEVRGERGGVTRNLATTHLLDRLAAHFGEACYEVPVGFKHLAASMKEQDVLLAGESSGGLSIRGHILGKDGIFACALVVEMLARTRRPVSALLDEIYRITGRLYTCELNLPATSEMKVLAPRKLEAAPPTAITGCPVVRISRQDGTKFYLENDGWLLLRFSGTEPLLRIFAEAGDPVTAQALVDWGRRLVEGDRSNIPT